MAHVLPVGQVFFFVSFLTPRCSYCCTTQREGREKGEDMNGAVGRKANERRPSRSHLVAEIARAEANSKCRLPAPLLSRGAYPDDGRQFQRLVLFELQDLEGWFAVFAIVRSGGRNRKWLTALPFPASSKTAKERELASFCEGRIGDGSHHCSRCSLESSEWASRDSYCQSGSVVNGITGIGTRVHSLDHTSQGCLLLLYFTFIQAPA